LKTLFENFISYIKHEENLSPHTVSAYSADVEDFLSYLSTQNVLAVKEINHLHIRSYLSLLYGKLDKRSIARKTVLFGHS